ncbi:hypothetical protein [Glaciibacter sp. 2TAF33]|uniref:hypothetical protein n=1 Tax=Glaciibacter sp. 2TAF33 TaxID=3233015 RepID=UPI003F90A286
MTNGDGVRRQSLARVLIGVVIVGVLLVGALFAAVGSLNRDVYSAGGFVRQYLDALARHDTASALALEGVRPSDAQLAAASLPQDLPETLLRASVLGSLTDIALVSDRATKPGLHTVKFGFTLNGEPGAMEFSVQNTGTFAAVFNSWRFSVSPLAVLQVTVMHAADFTVNGLSLDARAHAPAGAPATFSNQAAYLAFAPAAYSFAHESSLLTAPKTTVPVTASGAADVTVDAEPNDAFVTQVQTELNKFLDDCATQEVLQPSNCPFGIDIDDRVKGLPAWSIAEYPAVTLAAGETTFDMPDTPGRAHIVVVVQSLFDGEVSTTDEDVPFAVGLSVAMNPDGSLRIQLH